MSRSTDYEAILLRLGGFGAYQIFTYVWYLMVCYTLAMQYAFMYFGAILPKELCFGNNSSDNSNPHELSSYHRVSINASTSNASCFLFYKFNSMSVEWELYGPREYIMAMMTSLQMIGCICGSLVSGHLSDHWGRRPVFMVGFAGLIASRLLSGFVPEWKSYTALTFANGFAWSTVFGSYLILLIEVLTPRWRLLAYFFSWPVGYILLGVCGYVFDDFRSLTFAICIPAPFVFIMSFWIYESPKWLIQAKNHDRASAVLVNIGRRNGIGVSMAKSIVDDMVVDEPISTTKQQNFAYWNLFYNGASTIQFLTLFLCYLVIGAVYYGLVLDSGNLTDSPAVSIIVLNIANAFAGASLLATDQLCAKFGRRKMVISGNILVFSCLVLQVLLHLSAAVVKYPLWLVTGASLVGLVFCTLIWAGLDMFAMELFPTELKTMGFNLCSISGYVGAAIAPQINLSKVVWGPLPYLIYPVMMIPCMVLVWFMLPETKGCALPDFTVRATSTDKMGHVEDALEKEIMLQE